MTLDRFAGTILPARLHERLKASEIARRLARGSAWSLFGSASARILMLVAMVLVARMLGQASFGAFGLVQSTLGVVGLLAGIGLGNTATRFVAQHAATDPDRAGRVIALMLAVSAGTVLIAAAALVAGAGPLASIAIEAAHLQGPLMVGALLMAATGLRGIQNGVLAGLERFDLIAKLNILDGLLSLAAAVALTPVLGVEGALLGLALAAGIAWVAGSTLMAAELRRRGIALCWRGALAERGILTSYSLPSFLANMVATPVLWGAMTLMSRSEHGFGGLGAFYAAYQWHGPIILIPIVLMSVSVPTLVQEWEAGRRARFRSVTLWILALTLAIAVPPAMLVGLLSPWIMSVYGTGFREAWPILVLLVAAAPLHAVAKIASGALLGMNRAWWVLGINLAWGATMVAATLWLLPALGGLGLAVAFLAAYGVLASLAVGLVLAGSRPQAAPGLASHPAPGAR